MSLAASKSPFFATFKSLGALFLFIAFGLFLDSYHMLEITINAQFYANISMFIGFVIVFWQVNSRIKEQMISAVLFIFSCFFCISIGFGAA